jgi:DNA topoisomerase-3
VPTPAHPQCTCDFKTGQVILQQTIEPEQLHKLRTEGRTDVLQGFVSQRTRRPFKARLAWSEQEGKVVFEFEPREGDAKRRGAYGARSSAKPGTTASKSGAGATTPSARGAAATTPRATTKTAIKTTAKAAAKPKAAPRAGNLTPSPALAAVIGPGPFGRGEVMKKLWDYIKAHNLQDPQDKRTILADAKLHPLFDADRVGMFKLAGIVGKHLKSR